MTDIILLTGFFGSGKTTMLNRMLGHYRVWGKRIGIILNEYGKICIDSILIENREEYRLVEITDGSIFCGTRQSVFIDGLAYYSGNPVDILIIETSGFADPSGMEKIVAGVNEQTGGLFRYSKCVTMVDSTNFRSLYDTVGVLRKQVESATHIVINKIDLAGDDELAQGIRPEARFFYSFLARIPMDELDAVTVSSLPCRQYDIPHLSENAAMFHIHGEGDVDLHTILELLGIVTAASYRVKGHFHCRGSSYYFESLHGELVYRQVQETGRPGCIMVIGPGIGEYREGLHDFLRERNVTSIQITEGNFHWAPPDCVKIPD